MSAFQIINSCCYKIHSHYSTPYIFHFTDQESNFFQLRNAITSQAYYFQANRSAYINLLHRIHELKASTPELQKTKDIQRVWMTAIQTQSFSMTKENLIEALKQISKEIVSEKEKNELLEDFDFERSLQEWGQEGNNPRQIQASKNILDAYYSNSSSLTLNGMNLQTLPFVITRLSELKRICLNDNLFEQIPEVLFNLTNLDTLDMNSNRLKKISENIHFLKNLTSISLANNEFRTLPTAFFELVNLTKLNLDDNIGLDISWRIQELHLLTSLSLNHNQLSQLPQEIGKLSKLQFLHLNGNQLTFLPWYITKLKKLMILDVDHNRIEELPEYFFNKLPHLETLLINGNLLTSLPKLNKNHYRLTNLYCSDNQLNTLDPSISYLRKLRVFYVSKNNLHHLPDSFYTLYDLHAFKCSNNHLLFISPNISQLWHLKKLSLNDNPELSDLPINMGSLHCLEQILCRNTAINPETVETILTMSRSHRGAHATMSLDYLIPLWQSYARGYNDKSFDLTFLLTFNEKEKDRIQRWLFKLSQTKDFRGNQTQLAYFTCSMLEHLKENSAFKNFFEEYFDFNDEGCEDRTAMVFNVLYTQWVLSTLDPHAPLKEKLSILKGVAKTITLRKELESMMEGMENVSESVEIFLFCETNLKERLHLVTAINNMKHSQIGKRPWINLDELANTVEATYKTEFVRLQATQELANNSQYFKEVQEEITTLHIEYEHVLDRIKFHLTDTIYLQIYNLIMNLRQNDNDSLTYEWADCIMQDYNPQLNLDIPRIKKIQIIRSKEIQRIADGPEESKTLTGHKILKNAILNKYKTLQETLDKLESCEKNDLTLLKNFLEGSKQTELTNLTLLWVDCVEKSVLFPLIAQK